VHDFIDAMELNDRQRMIAERVLKEINARLRFLVDVGLDYLSLDRRPARLSGGEAQRIRLATQIGRASSASSTCWTSRASGCTSGTTTG
jgi:excinuclease ABC subunit A